GGEGQANDLSRPRVELVDHPATFRVVEVDHVALVGGGREGLAVGRQLDVLPPFAQRDGAQFLPRGEVPQVQAVVDTLLAAGQDRLAAVGEGEAGIRPARVTGEAPDFLAGSGIPHADRLPHVRRRDELAVWRVDQAPDAVAVPEAGRAHAGQRPR